MAHTVFIALGSNLGDRLSNLREAIGALAPQVRPQVCSPVYETPPWGYADQPRYLNQVMRAETELEPGALLDHLKQVETRVGRAPTFRYGPRVIDLDILFYDDLVLESGQLEIPHPRLPGRAFVLVPLAEIAPEHRHPVLGLTVGEMLQEVDVQEIAWYAPSECGEIDRPGEDLPKFEEESTMSEETDFKPLKWSPAPGVGYTVKRRPDGGMHYTFSDTSPATLAHWREFALDHLLDADRLTRNLYDLSQLDHISEEAIEYAVEANTDPSARNIRLAVVVGNPAVREAIQEIKDLTTPGGVEIGVFDDVESAEAWLDRPLSLMI